MEAATSIKNETIAALIRKHEREREENAQHAAARAIDYILSRGLVTGPDETAFIEAVKFHGESVAAERIITDLRQLLA